MSKEGAVPPHRLRLDWLLIGLMGGLVAVGLIVWFLAPVDIHRLIRLGGVVSIVPASGNRVLAWRGTITCFDARTGQVYWSRPWASYQEPIVQDGIVVYAKDTHLGAVQLNSGVRLWEREFTPPATPRTITSVVANGPRLLVMFMNSPGNPDYAEVDVNTGHLIAAGSFTPHRHESYDATVEGQVAYVSGGRGGMYAYDLRAHRMIWSHAGQYVPSGILMYFPPPILCLDTVVFMMPDGWVLGVERKTGKIVWRISIGGSLGPACLIGSTLVLSTARGSSGAVVGLGVGDGSVQFQHEVSEAYPDLLPINNHEAAVFFQDQIFRLSVPSGALYHAADLPAGVPAKVSHGYRAILPPPAVSHRLMLIPGSDGWVYTLNLDSMYFHSLFEKSYKSN